MHKLLPNITYFFLLLLYLFHALHETNAQYAVEVFEKTPLGGRRTVARCEATGATFGDDILNFSFGINAIGCAIPSKPELACSPVRMPYSINHTHCINNFAVVPRGNCSFSEKAYYVQSARPKAYDALIVYNYKGQGPIPMSGGKYKDAIEIPVVMISYQCMEEILSHFTSQKGYLIVIKATPGYYDLIKYLVPFVAIVGFCFIVLLLIRICRERRRLARKRLSRSNLKKLPTKKWKKGEPEETCAICLEDFQDGDKLRILLCKHAYHCKCIDPWLTKNRKVCPVCKRKVGPRSKNGDSSDSDSDDRTSPPTNIRENDSLLRNAQPMATTSSAEFPYPQQTIASLSDRNNNRVFRLARMIRFDCLTNTTTNAENVESGYQTTPVPRASRVSSIEEPIPQTQRPLSRFHNAFSNVRSRISTLVSGTINNHTRLDNDDTSTTTTRDELGYPSSNVGAGSASSFDGHSMTTVTSNQRSNHHLVTVEVEPSAPIEDTSVEVEDTSSLQSQRMDVGIPFISNPSCCTQSVLSHSSIETSNGPAN